MKYLLLIPFTLFFSFFADDQAIARQQTMTFDANTSMLLMEFSAVLMVENDQLKVQAVIGHGNTEGDQLKKDDLLIMMNGKRPKDIASIRSLYESIAAGEEIKIGVRRGQESLILRAPKSDPNNPVGGNRMVMRMETDDASGLKIIASLGLAIIDRDNKAIVEEVLEPLAPDVIKDLDIAGYQLSSVNGTEITDTETAFELIEALDAGSEIKLTFNKEGAEKSVTLPKPEGRGRIMIGGN